MDVMIVSGCALAIVAVACLVVYCLNARVSAALDRLFEGDTAKRKLFVGLVLRSPYLQRKRSILYRIARAVRASRADNLDHEVLGTCGLSPLDEKTILLYYFIALRGSYIPS
jgi:hypothetical protein